MPRDVLVSVKGTQFMGEESDTIEIITPGTWYEKSGKQYLIYEETFGETGEVTRNTVKIAPDRIEVTKRGLIESQMIFECGKKHVAHYVTPVGLIMLGITTSALELEQDEHGLYIAIRYSLEMNGEYVSGCSLELAVKERGEGALRLT